MSKNTNDYRRRAEARNEEGYLEALSIKHRYEDACRHLKACQDGNSPLYVHEDKRWIVYHEQFLPFKQHNKILESRMIHFSSENKRLSSMNARIRREASLTLGLLESEKSELEAAIAQITLEKERLSTENARLLSIIASMKKTTKVATPRFV